MVIRHVQVEKDDRLDGFVVQDVTGVPEHRLVAVRMLHETSGARWLHLASEDEENLFSITFPTPPPDDTGVAHILEHAVLGGSRRYPVRDPYFEMLKRSMATLLNAMTGTHCTFYPVASTLPADLFNLASVCYDAVFHPQLAERTFRREGHHLRPADREDPAGALTISGIVYNEMKGALSSPERRLMRAVSRGLQPDTACGRDSGGDPEHIPELTYEDFRSFHAAHYQPGNAYFFTYGCIPLRQHAAFLEERLAGAHHPLTPPLGNWQPRWSAPRSTQDSFPIGRQEPEAERALAMVAWLVGDVAEPVASLRLAVLSQVLLGHEAAPLRKAIVASHLGHDLLLSGWGPSGRATTFRVGLRGTEVDRGERFETLVLQTLEQVAREGIAREQWEAALQQVQYSVREITPRYPMQLMDRVITSWLHGADPLAHLCLAEHLEACRREWEQDPELLTRQLREDLLENPHRLLVTLAPDREWQERAEARVARRLSGIRERLSDDEARELAREASLLQEEAATPNSPEALATLPELRLEDLPATLRDLPTSTEELPGGIALLHNDLFAGGISYLCLDLDLAGLPERLWPYVPMYLEALVKLGAAGMGYEEMARRQAACTGGITPWVSLTTHASDPSLHRLGVRVSLRTLDEQVEPALALLGDLLLGVDPRDPDRLQDVLVQARATQRSALVRGGAGTAAQHAGRHVTLQGHLQNLLGGLPQLALLEDLCEHFPERAEAVMESIEAIRDHLLQQGRLTVCCTGPTESLHVVRRHLQAWAGALRPGPVESTWPGIQGTRIEQPEGLAGPVQVAHSALVLPAPHSSHPDAPLIALGAHLVRFDYLIRKIRLQGNAYGTSCGYDSLGGTLTLTSTRDPHVTRTLRILAQLPDHVRQVDWDAQELQRAVIATTKLEERPVRPGNATTLALARHRSGITHALRQDRYERMRAARPDQVQEALLALLEAGLPRGAACVVASREMLEAASQELPLSIQDILR